MITPEATYVKFLLTAQFLNELTDELKNTPYYKQRIKRLLNELETESVKIITPDLVKLYNKSTDNVVELMKAQESLITNIAKLNFLNIVEVSKIISHHIKKI